MYHAAAVGPIQKRLAGPSLAVVCFGALGGALGFSQFIRGAYDESAWSPIALGILVVLLALAVGVPRRPPLAGVPLLGLAIWSLVSSAWGGSTDAAWIAGNRWLLYAIALTTLIWLIGGDRRRAELLLIAAAAGVLAVTGSILLRMLSEHGASLFLGSRLNDPLGYVNGEAGYLLAALWPFCALAERRRSPALAGLGAGAVVALVALGVLTRSRSWELALGLSALTVILAFPGRRRRIAMLLTTGAAIALIRHPLVEVSARAGATDAVLHHAALAIIVAAVLVGTLWGFAGWLLERLAATGTRRRVSAGRSAAGALSAVGVVAVVGLAISAPALVRKARADARAFTHLSTTATGDRLLSGGGNRYDYWRVAWLEFRGAPLDGVGAGNYQPGYYRQRRTTEAIQQPHSLELQTLAELGVVGAALLAAFLVIVAAAIVKSARATRRDGRNGPLAVAATGTFVGWLAQTSVDWEHLIPGLTAIALVAVAGLLAITREPGPALARRGHVGLIAAAAGLAIAGSVLIVPRELSLRAEASAQRALAGHDPSAAVADATRSLGDDGSSVPALVLRSAAFARLDAFGLARADLQHALRVEPENWVTWALMGDLLRRRGELGPSRAAYRRAQTLDPREPSLAEALKTDV